jgi:hypothetical protein
VTLHPECPLIVCVFDEPVPNASRTVTYPHYIFEILDHAGLFYQRVHLSELPGLLRFPAVLLTVGDTKVTPEAANHLAKWVESGGAWISIGGLCGCDELFGARADLPSYRGWGVSAANLGEGYLVPGTAEHLFSDSRLPLHFFNGLAVQATTGTVLAATLDSHQRPIARAGLIENCVGAGRALLLGPDLTGTIVRIQQGIGVTRDGVSAPDGTAPLADNVLKSGDGSVLDWMFDRLPVEGIPGLCAYTEPIADCWRELLLRMITHCAQHTQTPIPQLWYYPENRPAMAHLSHDSDMNEEHLGEQLLDVLEKGGLHSTWCIILPGYSPGLMAKIKQAGHELAMHYDAMSQGKQWSSDEFHEQFLELASLFEGESPVTNKNHYLRYEGDMELFHWCASHGILMDQTKGASKPGEAGYNFGTCHVYFPAEMQGQLSSVLELATPTQDFEVFISSRFLQHLIRAAEKHHGIMHLLFHPAHIAKVGVAQSLLEAIAEARRHGLEWWTAREISTWERARRTVSWSAFRKDGDAWTVSVTAQSLLENATIRWVGCDDNAEVLTLRPGEEAKISTVAVTKPQR